MLIIKQYLEHKTFPVLCELTHKAGDGTDSGDWTGTSGATGENCDWTGISEAADGWTRTSGVAGGWTGTSEATGGWTGTSRARERLFAFCSSFSASKN